MAGYTFFPRVIINRFAHRRENFRLIASVIETVKADLNTKLIQNFDTAESVNHSSVIGWAGDIQ